MLLLSCNRYLFYTFCFARHPLQAIHEYQADLLLLLVATSVNFICWAVNLLLSRGKAPKAQPTPLLEYMKPAVTNTVGPALGILALKNIPYSSQVCDFLQIIDSRKSSRRQWKTFFLTTGDFDRCWWNLANLFQWWLWEPFLGRRDIRRRSTCVLLWSAWALWSSHSRRAPRQIRSWRNQTCFWDTLCVWLISPLMDSPMLTRTKSTRRKYWWHQLRLLNLYFLGLD